MSAYLERVMCLEIVVVSHGEILNEEVDKYECFLNRKLKRS